MRCHLFLLMLLCTTSFAAPTTRSLEEFGDIGTLEAANAALEAAMAQIISDGGGVLVIPPDAPERLKIDNLKQAERTTSNYSPVVTIMDYRRGYAVYHVAPIGKWGGDTWAGLSIVRKLNLGEQSLPHCGVHAAQGIANYVVSGTSSYMATLTDAAQKGTDARCYVDTIRGIWVGANLNVTSSVVGYAPPYDRVTVKSIAWDPERRCNYFTCDLEYDHPAGALVYNKHFMPGLLIAGYSNSDNQTAGELAVTRHNYAVGDSFVISGMFKYMGDVFSGFGDEGGIVLNAETVGEVDGFHSTVESVDWTSDTITYKPGKCNAQTLSTSRPLINMNRDKWITQGTVVVVSPSGEYKGQKYPGVIGGPANVFNYQGGAIIGSEDCPWDESILGRFFCLTEDTETILPGDPSTVGGYASAADRPIYRWYQINGFERNPDGTKRIRILRVRWSAVAAGAPTLFLDDNYTSDGHERPMTYAIAPGAWVYDVSQGWADVAVTGGHVDAGTCPRKVRVTPNGDRGTQFDFAPEDPIEQPPGPDPWQPRPLRIRQFDQMPSTMGSATIELQQLGRVQVPNCISISGLVSDRGQLPQRKDGKPSFGTIMDIQAASKVGIDFHGDVLDTAIMFRQPGGHPQPIRWRNDVVGSSSLGVDAATGDFVLTGGNVDLTGKALRNTRGLSATGTAASNLRGINVAVQEGKAELEIRFDTPEADGAYAVTVTPSWMTAIAVPAKSPEGFRIQFATPAPEGARVDWLLVR
ncbi:MAG: hypothetical protein KBI47_03245 [Armatimonadetes bacterium]|nr:hypothetical protein [Armatimonadota bacterium]